jgi:CRP/FNR family transcriptional regulator, cyclic AMP receptor protein
MAAIVTDSGFFVWGIDQTAYGPVELPTLVSWVKDQRVTADTWIFATRNCSWQEAADVPELQMFFRSKPNGASNGVASMTTPRGLDPRALRRIKILGTMTDEQLERFADFVEVEKVPQWSLIVKQGDPGNSMYFVLEGELRARISVLGQETVLATLSAGDFFGDISLFDHGPRSADVVANNDSLVVKFSAAAFDKLANEAPEIATPFLRAVGRTLSARIRNDNKRYGDSVKFSRAA